jgi:protein-S-isoprenylcysteine O-methyltransferase Ste14
MFGIDISFYILVIIYLSIVYEITILPVPSVASTYQLFFVNNVDSKVLKYGQDGLLKKVRNMSWLSKVLILFVPTAISVVNYCFPISVFFMPSALLGIIIIETLRHDIVILVALLMMFVGRTLSIKSVLNIREQNTQKNDDFDLKTIGLFRLSRNPILMGMYITYWGIFLLIPNWITLLGFVLYAANMHFRILLEEDFLRLMFGAKFNNYLANTSRYF